MRLCKLFLALGVVALLGTPVFAQGRGGRGGSLDTLVQNKSVQEELKLDKDSVTKAEEATKKVREDLKDEFSKIARGSTASDEDKAAARKKIAEAQEKALKGVLSDKQFTRLQQIQRQQRGAAVLQDEEVQKALKLDDKQKDKIKEINDQLRKDMADLRQGGFNRENLTKMQEARKEAMTKAVKVLNDDQAKTFKELTGAPFEIKFEPQAGRGGRGGQGRKPRSDF
jgi:hypothetical protein